MLRILVRDIHINGQLCTAVSLPKGVVLVRRRPLFRLFAFCILNAVVDYALVLNGDELTGPVFLNPAHHPAFFAGFRIRAEKPNL